MLKFNKMWQNDRASSQTGQIYHRRSLNLLKHMELFWNTFLLGHVCIYGCLFFFSFFKSQRTRCPHNTELKIKLASPFYRSHILLPLWPLVLINFLNWKFKSDSWTILSVLRYVHSLDMWEGDMVQWPGNRTGSQHSSSEPFSKSGFNGGFDKWFHLSLLVPVFITRKYQADKDEY